MRYLCDICGSSGHPTEEHMKQIDQEVESPQKMTLGQAMEVLGRLDPKPSSPETLEILDQSVDQWLANTDDEFVKQTVTTETEHHKARGLNPLYSEALLRSLYGRLADKDSPEFKQKRKNKSDKDFIKIMLEEIRDNELTMGYHRIWAKNLSRSEVDSLYFSAVKDSRLFLSKLEQAYDNLKQKIDSGADPVELFDRDIIELIRWRDALFSVDSNILDWEQTHDTNLDELHHGEDNLKVLLENIDAVGRKLIKIFPPSNKYPFDERMDRLSMGDAWYAAGGYWWVQPANWHIDSEREQMLYYMKERAALQKSLTKTKKKRK